MGIVVCLSCGSVTVYNVANKFDTVVNELVGMSEYKYEK